jgi:hypothetical protein
MTSRANIGGSTPWEPIGRARGLVFGTTRPATAMVELARLIDPAMLVEIAADAIVAADAP